MHDFYILTALFRFLLEVAMIYKIYSMLSKDTPIPFKRIDPDQLSFLRPKFIEKFFRDASDRLV
jgi:hypothetical protein